MLGLDGFCGDSRDYTMRMSSEEVDLQDLWVAARSLALDAITLEKVVAWRLRVFISGNNYSKNQ
jgi:hypothetical protein